MAVDNHLYDLGTIVALNAARSPRRKAIIDGSGLSWTHAQLEDRAVRLANALRGLGLNPGDRVGAWMDDAPEYIALYVAAAKAGLTVVPVNHRLTPTEAGFQLNDTEARALFYTADLAERVSALELADKPMLVRVGDAKGAPGHTWDDLISGASKQPLPTPDPDSLFMICFTSGTTGTPKGAMLTHRSITTLATTQLVGLRIPIGAVNLQVVSMSFPATVGSHLISHLLAGGTQVLYGGRWDSDRVVNLVDEHRVTHIYVPGPAIGEFSDVAERDPARWRSLNSVLHAGSRADPEDLKRLASVVGTRFVEGWGMTEISGGVATATTVNDLLDCGASIFTKVGRAVPGTQVVAVGDDRRPVPADAEGELAVKSASVFAGYWHKPEITAKVLSDGWYYTGDVGAVDEDGYVSIADRRTNLIVSGGMNVYPAEVELAVARCPGVLDCAVVAGPHQRWGQTPVAVVVRDPSSGLTEEVLLAHLRSRLASYKKPTRVIWVDELPRTTGGKIARGILRDKLGLGSGA